MQTRSGLLTAREAAELLGVRNCRGEPSARWVMDRAKRGELPSVVLPGGKYRRFEVDVLTAWWAGRRRGPRAV